MMCQFVYINKNKTRFQQTNTNLISYIKIHKNGLFESWCDIECFTLGIIRSCKYLLCWLLIEITIYLNQNLKESNSGAMSAKTNEELYYGDWIRQKMSQSRRHSQSFVFVLVLRQREHPRIWSNRRRFVPQGHCVQNKMDLCKHQHRQRSVNKNRLQASSREIPGQIPLQTGFVE